MFRTTNNDDEGLLKAYSSIYETVELNEEQIIESFNLWVDSLLEEGHDLSDYTYDGLYEYYLNEGRFSGVTPLIKSGLKGLGNILKGAGTAAWKGTTVSTKKGPKYVPGAEQSVRGGSATAARLGVKYGIPLAGLAALDQAVTGGKVKEWTGATLQGLGKLGSSIPSPGQKSPEKKYIPPASLTQSVDILDIVKGHLINEGYVDSDEAAFKIMAHMSDDWRTHIINLHSFNEV